MALLISFLIGIQLFHAVAPVSLPHFHSPSCNSPEVKAAAEAALNKHNAHRTEGYIIGLQRVFDAQEAVEDDYSFFNLLLDVLETRCHVRSRKSYKECEFRDPHETVFGQCKIIIRFDKKSNDSIMYKHDCTLQPVSSPPCPGCPISENVSEGRFREIAKEILAKFNAENRHIHYFGLVDVTKASTQVVSGILTTVEFTIQETACPKKVSLLGISRCPPLHFGTPEEALCHGSVINKGVGNPKSVSVNCDFFPHMMLHFVVSSPPFRFLPPMCNSSEVKVATEAALDKLNAHRKEGYVLGLQRIFDVHELPQWMGGSLFYITLDVLETQCHVQSRKLWKECKIRDAHETVYGQCKVTIHFNRNSNHSQLYSYDCVLHPLSPAAMAKICPDCSTPGDPSEATFWETAAESLAKFNSESNHVHYFTILNVTKARSQWVVGPSNFVEYTIQETSCSKSQPVSLITKCPVLPPNTAEAGLCKGSVVNSRIENRKFVTVKCYFFPHLTSVTDEQTPQSESETGQEEHHDDSKRDRNHHEENRHHHHHSHHQRHQRHKHHGHKHEDQEPHYPHRSANITEILPDQKEILGRVVIYPPSSKHVSLHSLPEVQAPKPTSKPSLTSTEQETSPHSAKSARPAIPPFPSGFSESPSCPGDLAIEIYGLQLPSTS